MYGYGVHSPYLKQVDDRTVSAYIGGMTIASRIIKRFGGIRPMASALGVSPSTVQTWSEGGFIPARRQQEVLAAAKDKGVDLSPADFFDAEPEPEPARKTA